MILIKNIFSDIYKDLKNNIFAIIICIISICALIKVFGTMCFFRLFLGIPCPACGISRATLLLLKGNVKGALDMHPLIILVIIGAILFFVDRYITKKYRKYINYYITFCLVIFIAFYIYRMVRYFPNKSPMIYYKNNVSYYIMEYGKRLHNLQRM